VGGVAEVRDLRARREVVLGSQDIAITADQDTVLSSELVAAIDQLGQAA
jgi:hypothetical protein